MAETAEKTEDAAPTPAQMSAPIPARVLSASFWSRPMTCHVGKPAESAVRSFELCWVYEFVNLLEIKPLTNHQNRHSGIN